MKGTEKIAKKGQKGSPKKAAFATQNAGRKKIQGATGPSHPSTLVALHGIDDLLSLGLTRSESESEEVVSHDSEPAKEIDDIKCMEESKSESQEQQNTLKTTPSRFERAVERAHRGEAGPIKIDDLELEPTLLQAIQASPLLDYYKKLLMVNPEAQPGRPMVNVIGDSDVDLKFQLLTLYEMVLAAKSIGRKVVQVSLVRISSDEAQALLRGNARQQSIEEAQPKELSLSEIAETNGFSELSIESIERDQNIRQQINTDSQEFRNLRESIRSIGLQNPPVVEVRQSENFGMPRLVCISGHRRLMALEALGIKKVVCALKKFQSMTHRTLAGLAENINREDLHFLDKAAGYGQLVKLGMTTAQIAVLLDGDVRTIGKYVRAAHWDESVKSRIRRLGSKMTVRYLLNTMAAGERTTAELQGMLDRIEFPVHPDRSKGGVEKMLNYTEKYNEFCQLMQLNQDQAILVKKALKYLGVLPN